MGQKTHPLGFRLGITQEHYSLWYFKFARYSKILEEDDKIRTYINTLARANGISTVKIYRNGVNDKIKIELETGKPGLLIGEKGVGLEHLLTHLKKILPSSRQITINIIETEAVQLNAALLADSIAEQLEKRVAFRRAVRGALQRAKKKNARGIKIQVSGRLNGAEMARSEWIREGRVPLQTLRASIDYATREANTIYGILGIKVWLFKNELISK